MTVLSGLTRRARSLDFCKGAHHVLHDLKPKDAETIEPVLKALETSEPEVTSPLAALNALLAMKHLGIRGHGQRVGAIRIERAMPLNPSIERIATIPQPTLDRLAKHVLATYLSHYSRFVGSWELRGKGVHVVRVSLSVLLVQAFRFLRYLP